MSAARARLAKSGALGALLAVALVGENASAFCRSRTVEVPASFHPTETTCWDQGKVLFWRNSCVGYSVQRDASKQVSFEDASNGLAAAFAQWTGSSCPGDGSGRSRVSIDVRDLGPVQCGERQYDPKGQNQNVIVFRDDKWPHPDPENKTLALTTVSFNKETGEIFDADMEINTFGQRMALSDPIPADGYDFRAIITHEAGHFLGLAHSGDNGATMYENYAQGTTKLRNLTSDDVAAICTVYRPDGFRAVDDGKVTAGPSCDPSPRRGLERACDEAPAAACATAARRDASTGSASRWIALAVGLLGVLVARRAR